MAQLNVTVRFLDGRYHGAEWPPSPARLFQALVASGKVGASSRNWNGLHEAALTWLETLGAPHIFAGSTFGGQSYRLFVPNNSLDTKAKDGRSTKTSKPVSPTILANHSVGEPDVIYRWSLASNDDAGSHLHALDQLAANTRSLGLGIDFAMVTASINQNSTAPANLECFAPGAPAGLSLRVPAVGLLSHLERCHSAAQTRISKEGIDPYTRPTRFAKATYRRVRSFQPRRWSAFELQTPDGEVFSARWDQAQTVAAWVRHVAGEALLREPLDPAWVNSYILGHTAPADLGHRLSFVPLPSVGHRHSDGGIRRLMIAEPPSATAKDAQLLDLLRIKLSGTTLIDSESKAPRAVLTPIQDSGKVLPFYTRTASVWETATPVVLHGHNATRGRISLAKTDRLLRQAFDDAGFPDSLIAEIAYQHAPYWSGCEAATAIRVPAHLSGWPRLHIRVKFKEPVPGPVLVGIGRHCGLGVFAARADPSPSE